MGGNIMITSTSYVICIRQERGFCNIGYSTNEISGSEYTLSNTGNSISKRTDSCSNAQIHIPLDPYSSIFCGAFFNQAQSNTANGVVFCKLFFTSALSPHLSKNPIFLSANFL